jgi:CO/xanthine dehydrogenase Mo-binding subunit
MPAVGEARNRLDARGKVTGATAYPGDLNPPNLAAMKILFAGRPHAIVRRIDTSSAEALPGVLAVLTARDVPVNEYGLIMKDQAVLCGPGSSKPCADRVRFVGDQVALVIAETEEIAAEGVQRIAVDYEDLPVVTDVLEARGPDAPLLHPETGSNVFCHYRIRKGDAAAGLARAAVVVDQEYRTPAQEHAFLQPEAGVGSIDEAGRVLVQVAGQWAHEDQEQIAHALGLPVDQVRVQYPAVGGAFGGREDMSLQIVLALAAWRLHQRGIRRPVRTIWSREESILGHHKRHPYVIRATWGATSKGQLIAAQMELIQDGGAYAYTSAKVLGNSTLMCTGPYKFPNVTVDTYSIYTNNIPNGAFRGFGGPQATFAAEGQMDRLAEALGMDPVEIRMANLLEDGDLLSVGSPLPPGVSIKPVVQACAEQAGWTNTARGWRRPPASVLGAPEEPHLRRGLGIACSFKNVGFSFGAPEQCTATIELHGKAMIERVVLHHAGADVGQGAHTVMTQMAADALSVPVDKVELIASDTAFTPDSGSASASRLTFMSGNSIRGAAEAALAKWKGEERPAIATYTYKPPPTSKFDPETGKCDPNFSYGYVAEAATVEVDTETGHVRLLNVVCADDVGKAVNPQLVKGQIEGGVVQASGYAVLEDFIQKDGHVVTPHLSTYLIPTILDVPRQVESLVLENPEPRGPFGARGMGEMPFLALAPAVVAAVRDAVGIWFNTFPLTPERVQRRLKEARGE